MKMLPKLLLGLISTLAVTSAFAVPLIVLPSGPVDGVGAQTYHDTLVWSVDTLATQQAAGLLGNNTSDFSFSTGSGGLGVIVYSKNGVQNDAPWAAPLEGVNNTSTFTGSWAGGTVGMLRTFLTVGSTQWQPLFIFDHNEPPNAQTTNLLIKGSVQINRGNANIATYFFDDNGNFVLSCGSPYVGPAAPTPYGPCSIPLPTPSGTTYHWTTNGSGAADYLGVMNGFNLYSGTFLDTDSFVVNMALQDQDGGFEELSIGGYQFAAPSTNIPEPGSLALFAGSLLMLGAVARRRAAKK